MDVLRDAKARPESRNADQEARERRVAQLVRWLTQFERTMRDVDPLRLDARPNGHAHDRQRSQHPRR